MFYVMLSLGYLLLHMRNFDTFELYGRSRRVCSLIRVYCRNLSREDSASGSATPGTSSGIRSGNLDREYCFEDRNSRGGPYYASAPIEYNFYIVLHQDHAYEHLDRR